MGLSVCCNLIRCERLAGFPSDLEEILGLTSRLGDGGAFQRSKEMFSRGLARGSLADSGHEQYDIVDRISIF